jgi:hypothetical protein
MPVGGAGVQFPPCKFLSGLAVFFLILAPALLAIAPAAEAARNLPRQGVIDQCDNGATSKSLLFTRAGNVTECYLAFDNHAIVDDAWLDMTLQGTRTSARTNPFDRTPDAFPITPWVAAGSNGTRAWAFDSTLMGPLGHVTQFSDGSSARSVTLDTNDGFDLYFDVPTNATITNATITLAGDPVPYWAQQYQITNSSWSDSEEGPYLMTFDGLLFAAWASADPDLVTGGSDLDVIVRAYNGTAWGPAVNLSPPPNQDTKDDREVVMTVYQDQLWVIWSHGDDYGDHGTTDLMHRTFDGTDWSSIGYISRVDTDGLNTYQNVEVYGGKLWVEWKTSDTQVKAVAGDNDLDIVVRAFDGATGSWGPITEITDPGNTTMDWISDIRSFDGKLYVAWEATNYDPEDLLGGFYDPSDILMRVFNGTAWGPIQVPSAEIDTRENNREDSAPRFQVYHNPVSGFDELYLVWMRGQSSKFVRGEDYDVVYRVFNGAAWSPATYLTEPGDTDDDMFPCMVPYNGVLYSFWVSGVNTSIVSQTNTIILIATYGDIVYRAYNGREWSTIKEVTPLGNLDNASHPTCTVYNNKLYAAWESPTNHADGTTEWDVTVRNIDFNKVALTGVYGGVTENYTAPVGLSFSDTAYPFNLTALNSLLGNEVVAQDAWGNSVSRIPLHLSTINPATVQVTGIDVRYEYHVRVNITQALREQIQAQKGDLYSTSIIRAPITVGMEDGAGRIVIERIHVDYRIDYPPELVKSIASIKIAEDSGLAPPFDLNDYFTDDWDAGRLRFEMSDATNTEHVYFFLDGSQLSVGTLTPNWCGVATFKITAYDRNAYYAVSNDVTVFVTCVNDAPVLEPIGDQELTPNQAFSGDVSATDPDIGDVLRFSTDSPWVTVDERTGAFLIGDKPGTPDEMVFNITVTDLAGANDTQGATFRIVRSQEPIVDPGLLNVVDFPYYLLLLLLGPLVGYTAYRVRAHRLQALAEAQEQIQRHQDHADLAELEEP